MADAEHVEILRQGYEVWNKWRADHPEIMRPDIRQADLRGAGLNGANLGWADLRGADLRGAGLRESDLTSADFTGADLALANLRKANLRSAELSEAKLNGAKLNGAKLSEADLGWTDLSRAKLREADLCGAYIGWAELEDADLREAEIRRADLRGAKLRKADLSMADLSEADLSKADLSGANLQGTNLRKAKLGGAHLSETIFANANLENVEGLDNCNYHGPCTVDHRTLAQSGRLPLAFLRGCGLPDKFIDYLPSLFNEAIQFYSCFISFSTKDQEFADRLHADLQNNAVRCWFAPHDIESGKKVHEQIDDAIRVYDRLLLILSENSMKSSWVDTEISKARKRELREGRRMLFPVRLVEFETLRDWECFDADTGRDSAREIREYFIPDFSEWKEHDKYKKAFDRLLKDLKTTSYSSVKSA